MDINTIGALWIGPRMPDFHRMCVASWPEHGYEVDLFVYEPVENAPEGARQRDANEILPAETLFGGTPEFGAEPSRANSRADIFRLAMLAKGGRVWCDTDYLMLRRLPALGEVLVGREPNGFLCNAVLWLPPGNEMLTAAPKAFFDRAIPPWSGTKTRLTRLKRRLAMRRPTLIDYPMHQWGRHALMYFMRKQNLLDAAQPPKAFYHDGVYDYRFFEKTTPYQELLEDQAVHGLHFFRKDPSRFAAAEEGGLIGWAKRRYLK